MSQHKHCVSTYHTQITVTHFSKVTECRMQLSHTLVQVLVPLPTSLSLFSTTSFLSPSFFGYSTFSHFLLPPAGFLISYFCFHFILKFYIFCLCCFSLLSVFLPSKPVHTPHNWLCYINFKHGNGDHNTALSVTDTCLYLLYIKVNLEMAAFWTVAPHRLV
jgi:hypothetical protein